MFSLLIHLENIHLLSIFSVQGSVMRIQHLEVYSLVGTNTLMDFHKAL